MAQLGTPRRSLLADLPYVRRGIHFRPLYQPSLLAALLKHMRQLMCKKPQTCSGARRILPGSKYYVISNCIGSRIQRPG